MTAFDVLHGVLDIGGFLTLLSGIGVAAWLFVRGHRIPATLLALATTSQLLYALGATALELAEPNLGLRQTSDARTLYTWFGTVVGVTRDAVFAAVVIGWRSEPDPPSGSTGAWAGDLGS